MTSRYDVLIGSACMVGSFRFNGLIQWSKFSIKMTAQKQHTCHFHNVLDVRAHTVHCATAAFSVTFLASTAY